MADDVDGNSTPEPNAGDASLSTTSAPSTVPTADPSPAESEGTLRATIEFLILLTLGIMLLRTFSTEAYVVPTGSMAPTLLGYHRELNCTNCRFPFVVGMDEKGQSGRAVCPNCGQVGLAQTETVDCNGDRLLVQKFLFDLRTPRRFEVVVFNSPSEPDQPYVKRVVGLPGEAIQIVDGDLFINGRIVRKTIEEQRAMRIAVYDNNFVPADYIRFPRWRFRVERSRRTVPSGWKMVGTGFSHEATETSNDREDWLEYLHYDPDRGRYGPIRDFCPYNGADVRAENPVRDLMIDTELTVQPNVRSVSLRIDHGMDQFVITLPVDGKGSVEVRRNGLVEVPSNPRTGLLSSPAESPRYYRLEAAVCDRRLQVALDGRLLFEPIDFEKSTAANMTSNRSSPVALGVLGGSVSIRSFRVFRDIYYTGSQSMGPRLAFAVDSPYFLKTDEYFVLGDNSPVSNDSRFWEKSPVVRRESLLGKPFLVHLPGQVRALKVFGRPLGWIPDPREIRYIR